MIHQEGGSASTAAKGAAIAREMLAQASQAKRVKVGLDKLTLALECGGSDAFSGISANPAVGVAADRLVENGGTVILSEINEMVGTAEILKRRAADAQVAEKIDKYVEIGTEAAGWRSKMDFFYRGDFSRQPGWRPYQH